LKKKFNPFLKLLRSRLWAPKVVQSKKVYNRKKEKKNTLKEAVKKED
tara:strand:- start:39748 stop:39888 length:141 start_codon:yes stop_codon:yes gene_type:complete